MLVKIEIRYKREPYAPAVYVCDYHAFFMLWFLLKDNISISKIDVYDIVDNRKLDLVNEGSQQSLCQQYRGEV